MKPPVPNVLASRYASAEMAELWSAEHKVVLERRLWLAVLRAQRELGVEVPDGVVEAYEAVVDQVVDAGIKAILNFSPGALKVPVEVKLKSVDLTVSLESLSFYLAQGDEQNAP